VLVCCGVFFLDEAPRQCCSYQSTTHPRQFAGCDPLHNAHVAGLIYEIVHNAHISVGECSNFYHVHISDMICTVLFVYCFDEVPQLLFS
jgi:hypothetical protein